MLIEASIINWFAVKSVDMMFICEYSASMEFADVEKWDSEEATRLAREEEILCLILLGW
jgi:hypothetical protein